MKLILFSLVACVLVGCSAITEPLGNSTCPPVVQCVECQECNSCPVLNCPECQLIECPSCEALEEGELSTGDRDILVRRIQNLDKRLKLYESYNTTWYADNLSTSFYRCNQTLHSINDSLEEIKEALK